MPRVALRQKRNAAGLCPQFWILRTANGLSHCGRRHSGDCRQSGRSPNSRWWLRNSVAMSSNRSCSSKPQSFGCHSLTSFWKRSRVSSVIFVPPCSIDFGAGAFDTRSPKQSSLRLRRGRRYRGSRRAETGLCPCALSQCTIWTCN